MALGSRGGAGGAGEGASDENGPGLSASGAVDPGGGGGVVSGAATGGSGGAAWATGAPSGDAAAMAIAIARAWWRRLRRTLAIPIHVELRTAPQGLKINLRATREGARRRPVPRPSLAL